MNKQRRTSIRRAESYLDLAVSLVQGALYEEQDALDNMPENLQTSERYEAMEDAVDNLEDALSSLREAKDYLDRAAN